MEEITKSPSSPKSPSNSKRKTKDDTYDEKLAEKLLQRELKLKKRQLQEENSKKYIEYLELQEEQYLEGQ